MRALVMTLLLIVCFSAPAAAQQRDERAALKRKGSIKMWVGAALVGAGALAVPVTAVGPRRNGYDPKLLGVGLIGAGSALVWLGAQDRQKGMQPNTTVGVTIGRVQAVQFRRTW